MSTLIHPVPTAAMDRIIEMALAEDNPRGDLTALTIVPEGARATAVVQARQPGVLSGGAVFARTMQLVDAQLAKSPYLAGGTFTAADISVGYALAFGTFLSLDDGYSAAIKDYQQRITSREAFQRASAVQ